MIEKTNTGFVKLSNVLFDDLSITNQEITILLLMYRHYMQYKCIAICSIKMLVDLMKNNDSNNRTIIALVKENIKSLIEKGYIDSLYNLDYDSLQIDDINRDTLFYAELIAPPTDNFFMVYDKDLNVIFSKIESTNISKFGLVRYFIACKRVSNNEAKFGYLTQATVKNLIKDARTIKKYNDILQDDLHLIRYNNSYLTKDKKYCTTYIGNYDDETSFNHLLQLEVKSKGLMHTDKVISNKRRSVKQKINNLLDDKDGKIKELEERLKQYESLQHKNEDCLVKPIHKGSVVDKEYRTEKFDGEIDIGTMTEASNSGDFISFKAGDGVRKYLGGYVNKYEVELKKIDDGKLSIETFFIAYCDNIHGTKSGFIKSEENEVNNEMNNQSIHGDELS